MRGLNGGRGRENKRMRIREREYVPRGPCCRDEKGLRAHAQDTHTPFKTHPTTAKGHELHTDTGNDCCHLVPSVSAPQEGAGWPLYW